jgi:hypothetical protein
MNWKFNKKIIIIFQSILLGLFVIYELTRLICNLKRINLNSNKILF